MVIPKPEDTALHFADEQERRITSLRHRVIEQIRSHGDALEHRLEIGDEHDDVVEAIIKECEEQGWVVQKVHQEPEYGTPYQLNGQTLVPIKESGEKTLLLTHPPKGQDQ